jgi:hypothetical protein
MFSKDKVVELGDLEKNVDAFYQFHGVQLVGNGIPGDKKLITSIYNKLVNQKFDAGDYFQIIDNEDENRFM